MPEQPDPSDALLAFSRTLPRWVQDALRRICTKRTLVESDYTDLLLLLADSESPTDRADKPKPEPLAAQHIPPRQGAAPKTVLASLSGIEKANRLAKEQTLQFGIDGVTVVYGDNGSGKSGYVRVLKKLCRVRAGAEEEVLDNVYKPSTAGRLKATVRFKVGDAEPVPCEWQGGTPPPAECGRISVFDSRAAPIYADAESKVEVLPYLLDVLPGLCDVLTEMARRLGEEEKRLDNKVRPNLDAAPAGSPAAAIINRLQSSIPDQSVPSEAELKAAAAWDAKLAAELARIEVDLQSDPKARAASARIQASSLRSVADQIVAISAVLSNQAVVDLRERLRLRNESRAAATLAAEMSFVGLPLKGVGSEPWRRMFQYAREYSALAYPDAPFPVTGAGSRCLLCQQDLGRDAAARLRQFEDYVKDAAAAEADRQQAAVQLLATAIESLAIPLKSVVQSQLSAIPNLTQALSNSIPTYIEDAGRVRDSVRTALAAGVIDEHVAGLGTSQEGLLRSAAEGLEADAARLDTVAGDARQRQQLETRKSLLLGAKFLSERMSNLLLRRADLEERKRVRSLRKACDTAMISKKGTELRRQFLTKDFDDRLQEELRQLELDYLPVRVTDRTEKGANMIGVGLETLKAVKNSAVLSEGEFRGLALAAFLAEIGGYKDLHGIVVDDPVSSLDHQHRRQVARRLVREARNGRQVVIFTHDLAFFYEVRDAAIATDPPTKWAVHEVRKDNEHGPGVVHAGQVPWTVQKVSNRIDNLKKRLPKLRDVTDRKSDEYRRLVQDFRSDLRRTWERFVESELFYGVVTRFQSEVKTQSLAGAEVTDDDYRRIYVEMGTASSSSGHDDAVGRQQTDPSPDELGDDLDRLQKYLKEVADRRKVTEERRRRLKEPPAAELL